MLHQRGDIAVNSANLQLEGLYLAIASISETLVNKGVLSRGELDLALRKAERLALTDYRSAENLRAAERDAVAFPARLLLTASSAGASGESASFSDLARRVGTRKPPTQVGE